MEPINNLQNYQCISDETLCLLYRETKRQKVLVELLDRYEGYLLSVFLPFARNVDSVADFKADLFLHLQQVLLYSQPTIFKHWLGRIARNKLHDLARKHRPDTRAVLPDHSHDFSLSWDFEMDFESVQKAISQLQSDQQLYIELAFFQGYKQREICEQLDWYPETARKVRQNAMRNLRKLLGGRKSVFGWYLKIA